MELNLKKSTELDKLIASNYVKKIKHPLYDLFLLSYTKKTAIEANWNDLTLNSRGLIIDRDFNVISRPFKKFFEPFQLNENIKIPYELNHEIYEKLDGSLLISYWVGNSFFLTTKGKFDSFQAIVGNQIFKKKYSELLPLLDKKCTYIFELISPQTTNIIDYGNIEDLFLLDIIDTVSNASIHIESIKQFKKPQKYSITVSEAIDDNGFFPQEGYVVQFENDFRLKIKKERFKVLYHKHQAIKREILNSIYHSKPIEITYKNKSDEELIKLKDLYKKAINLLEFVHFYLKANVNEIDKLEIIEYFKIRYSDNKKLDFFILERLFITSQYYSLQIPYNVSFLKIS